MDLKTMLIAAFIGCSYASWPNLARPLNLSPGLSLFVILGAALIVLAALAPKDLAAAGTIRSLPLRPLIILLAVAFANGLATYLCATKCADPNTQTGVFLTAVILLEIAFAIIIDWLVNHHRPGALQGIGIALIVPVMWLLAQSPKKF